jgi:hypothetical protein
MNTSTAQITIPECRRLEASMFESDVYQTRRQALAAELPGSLILLPGNEEAPIDFRANVYPFHQDGSFRYFFGIDRPGLTGLIDGDSGEHWLFGNEPTIQDTIWLGVQPSLAEQAEAAGVALTG